MDINTSTKMGRCGDLWARFRGSTTVIIIIVFFSLFVDSMLLTLVDPILPDMLLKMENVNESDIREKAAELVNTGGRYGYLVAAKGFAQFLCNPFVGILVTRFGYRRPMLVGDIVLMISTVAFGYGTTYGQLFSTRIFQGISSSITAVTGMGLLASTFTDDTERGNVMGIAIGGISLGIIVGPIYGSVLYQFFGQALPFIILAATVGLTVILQILTLKADDSGGKDHSMKSMFALLTDPYILIVAGNIFLLNLDVSVILAFLPLHLLDLENAEPWKLGIVVLPTSIGYLIAGIIFPRTTKWLKRWLCAFIGMLISTISLIGLAFADDFKSMLIVTTFLGLALGMVSTSMQPIFAYLVDIRHQTVYGNVYAISDMAVCLAMFLGPLVGGPIVYQFGFEWLVMGIAIINCAFAQLSFLLRDPPARNKMQANMSAANAKLDSEKLKDQETVPLLTNSEDYKRRRSANSLPNYNTGTMDISHVPTARYMGCLSGVEDLYSDSEASRGQMRRKHRTKPAHKPDYKPAYSVPTDIDIEQDAYDSW